MAKSPDPNGDAFVEILGTFTKVQFTDAVPNSFLIFRVEHPGATPRSVDTKFRTDVCEERTKQPTYSSSTFTIAAPVRALRATPGPNQYGIVVEVFCLLSEGADLKGTCHIGFADIGETLRSRETASLDLVLDADDLKAASMTLDLKLGQVVRLGSDGQIESKSGSKGRILTIWLRNAMNLPDSDGRAESRQDSNTRRSTKKLTIDEVNKKLPSSFVSAKLLRDISRPAKAATQMINHNRNPAWSRPLNIPLEDDDIESGQTLFMALINNNTKKLIQKVLLPLATAKPNVQYNFRFMWERDDNGPNTLLDVGVLLHQGIPQAIQQYRSKSFIRLMATVNQFIQMLPDSIDYDEICVVLRLVGEGHAYAKTLPRPGKKSKKRKGPAYPLEKLHMPTDDPFEDSNAFTRNGPFVTRGISKDKPKIWNEAFVFEFPAEAINDSDTFLAIEIFNRRQLRPDENTTDNADSLQHEFIAYSLLPLNILTQVNLDGPDAAVIQLDDIKIVVVASEDAKAVFSLELRLWKSENYLKELERGTAEAPYDISKRARTAQIDRMRQHLAKRSPPPREQSPPPAVATTSQPSPVPMNPAPPARQESRQGPQTQVAVQLGETPPKPAAVVPLSKLHRPEPIPAQQQQQQQQPTPAQEPAPSDRRQSAHRPKSTHGRREQRWDEEEVVVALDESVSVAPPRTNASPAPQPAGTQPSFKERMKARSRGVANGGVSNPPSTTTTTTTAAAAAATRSSNNHRPAHDDDDGSGMLSRNQRPRDGPHPEEQGGMLAPITRSHNTHAATNGTTTTTTTTTGGGGGVGGMLPSSLPAHELTSGPELPLENPPLESHTQYIPLDQVLGDDLIDIQALTAPELHVQIPQGALSSASPYPARSPAPPKKIVSSDEYTAIVEMNVSYGSTLTQVMTEIQGTQAALEREARELVEFRRHHAQLVKESVLLQERQAILDGIVTSSPRGTTPTLADMPDLNVYPDDAALAELNKISAKAVNETRNNNKLEARVMALSKQCKEKEVIPEKLRALRQAFALQKAKMELLLQNNTMIEEVRLQAAEQEKMIEVREGVIEICLNNSAKGMDLREEIVTLEDENRRLENRLPSTHDIDRKIRGLRDQKADLIEELRREEDRAARRARKAQEHQRRPDPRLEHNVHQARENNRLLQLKVRQMQDEWHARQAQAARPRASHSRAAPPRVDPSQLNATEADRDDLESRIEDAEMMKEALEEERDSNLLRHQKAIADWQSKIEAMRAKGGMTAAGHRKLSSGVL